jgi:fimbrial isopeptide formation D2 family protein/LPXTG-motif cell wall-anchored protein
VLESEAGQNLIAATTNVKVNEKNDYPPLDKTQADDDYPVQSDANRSVAVGDTLNYEVKVTIPKTAKKGDKILVWDKAYTGLTYKGGVAVKEGSNTGNANISDVTSTDPGYVSDATWQKYITVVEGSQGTEVIFEFSMTVNSSALNSQDKKNVSYLKYGRGSGEKPFPYEAKPDEVKYETYFAGIEKVDGNNTTKKLPNVEFTLKKGNDEFKVSKPSGADYYVYDDSQNASSTVVTDENGLIKIRGLDNDKTYTLTETKNQNPGYNDLAAPIELKLHLDSFGTTTYTLASTYNADETYYTKDGNEYIVASEVDENEFTEGKYYTKSETSGSVYNASTSDIDTYYDVVKNFTGTILPSTGGIGTTIFYVVGGVMVAGAVVFLLTKRRMAGKE